MKKSINHMIVFRKDAKNAKKYISFLSRKTFAFFAPLRRRFITFEQERVR